MWRLKRLLTQEELARRAGVPRPNLSAIERGQREVSLKTVRALAVALDVRPGVLVDGIVPQEEEEGRLSRQAMERIADAVIRKTPLADAKEQALADQLKYLVRSRLRAAGRVTKRAVRLGRVSDRAWLTVSRYPEPAIESLVARILERRGG
ncbi:MAG: helix-turn-helix domain-containing protein [Candidatus Binatia bacterium]